MADQIVYVCGVDCIVTTEIGPDDGQVGDRCAWCGEKIRAINITALEAENAKWRDEAANITAIEKAET